MDSWRDMARPIIGRVISEHGTSDMKATRRALRNAYPWGERKYWPYKVWCDEVREQLGLNKKPIDVGPELFKEASDGDWTK